MLIQRVVTAIVLAFLSVFALFQASDLLWQGLMLLVVLIGAWEWAGLAQIGSLWKKGSYAFLTALFAILGLQFLSDPSLYWMTVIELGVLGYIVIRYQLSKGQASADSAWMVLVLGWLFLVLFAVVMVRFREAFSAQWLLASLFAIWAMDTGAYFSGRRFGKRKLAQYVSPGKTWEGVWGGALLAFVVTLLICYWLEPAVSLPYPLFSLLVGLIALLSVMGDLFESVLKRQVGLKDSGRILPGHGGMLDRIDSLLVAVPLFYLLWRFGSVG